MNREHVCLKSNQVHILLAKEVLHVEEDGVPVAALYAIRAKSGPKGE